MSNRCWRRIGGKTCFAGLRIIVFGFCNSISNKHNRGGSHASNGRSPG